MTKKTTTISIKDIAREAGVGLGTASRAASGNGYVSKEAKEKVQAAMKKLGYVPSHPARVLRSHKSNVVAFFVPTIAHPFFSSMAQTISRELAKHGYRMILALSEDDVAEEKEMRRMFEERLVDGAVFITHKVYPKLEINLPVVTIDRHLSDSVPFVTSNNYEATMQALSLLYEKGARRVGFLGGQPETESEVNLRHKAYLDFVKEKGLPRLDVFENIDHGQEKRFAEEYFNRHRDSDACFASSDYLALALVREASKRGLSVPNSFKVIGYDGALDEMVDYPKVSTMKQDIEAMGEKVVSLLLLLMKGEETPHKNEIPVTYVPGETT